MNSFDIAQEDPWKEVKNMLHWDIYDLTYFRWVTWPQQPPVSWIIIIICIYFLFYFLFTIFTLGVGQAMPVLPPLPASYTLSLFKFQLLKSLCLVRVKGEVMMRWYENIDESKARIITQQSQPGTASVMQIVG